MPVPAPIPTLLSSPTVPLHRVRFFDHTPSPITALAFSPTPLPAPSDPAAKGKAKALSHAAANELGVLVLARENGEVEIWEYVEPEAHSMGNWVLEKILPPTLTHPGVSLMALVIRDPVGFAQKSYKVPKLGDLRLYTSGSDSADLVERCLVTGRILQTYSIPAPPLWAMSVSPTHSLLALATTSPSLHFLSLTPSGLEPPPAHLLRCEPVPSRTRTVSIAWGPPRMVQESEEPIWQDTYFVTGNSDSSFRKWELPSSDPNSSGSGRVTIKGRSVVEKIKIQKKGKGTIVWGTAVLPDHTIVTSDSLGNVIFWDGASLAQKQSFKGHKADAMVLIPGSQGKTIYTGGPDQRVSQFTLVGNQWQMTATKRLHSHDIRALAVFPAYVPAPPGAISMMGSEMAPVLASGGWDMNLVLTPCAPPETIVHRLRNPLGRRHGLGKTIFEEAYNRKMSYLGGGRGTGKISISSGSRLVLGRKDRSVGIWRLFEEEQGWEKVLEMDLRLRTTLISSAISEDGKWLAVSDLYETKLFRLNSTISGTLIPRRVKTLVPTLLSSGETSGMSLETDGTGSANLVFTPDSSRLVMGLAISGQVIVLGLHQQEDDISVEVAKCFSRAEVAAAGRVINPKPKGKNGDMAPPETPVVQDTGEMEVDEDMESEEEVKKEELAKIACMTVSGDGQWLAVSDLAGKVSTYNMDTLRPHSVLPTLPHSPIQLLFPPTHPYLLTIILPTQSIQFYHVETPRLLPPIAQIDTLNRALRDQFLPIQAATFEPSRSSPKSAKIVLWSSDWVCTARLDLDLVARISRGKQPKKMLENNLRKKRAREAMEQLERTSNGSPSVASTPVPGSPMSAHGSSEISVGERGMSSTELPEFFKFTHDRFRSVAGIEWVGEGEMVVVERPVGDFVGELPAMFWTGGFGRS